MLSAASRTCPLRTAPDATLRFHGSRLTKTLLLSCHHNSFHYTWKRSFCFDPYCLTEELWLIWPYGGGIWKHVGEWETSRAQRKLDEIQVCLQVVFRSRGTNHRSRCSHVKLVQDENRYHGMECCRVQADLDGMWLGQEQEQGARD